MVARRRGLSILIMIMWLLLGTSVPVLALGGPPANINDTSTIVPAEEMSRQQGLSNTGPLQETRLDDSRQTLMTAIVAGVFIVLPVGIWIFIHQRKKQR